MLLSSPPSASCASQDLLLAATIPPEYQAAIMARCRWDEARQRWTVDHLEWAGNLVRWVACVRALGSGGAFGIGRPSPRRLDACLWTPAARRAQREAESSLSGSEASCASSGGATSWRCGAADADGIDGESGRLANACWDFSCKSLLGTEAAGAS